MKGKLSVQYNLTDDLFEMCSSLTGMQITDNPEEADAVIFGRDPKFGSRTKVFQGLFAGFDHLDLDSFPEDATLLSNAGAYSEPVAETVFALILANIKRVCEHNSDYHGVKFKRRSVTTLFGKSMGILGYGGIGRKVAEISRSFGMSVYAYSRTKKNDEIAEFLETPEELFSRSDVILVSVPLDSKTEGMVNSKLLSRFGGSMIVNVARANIVDRNDMLSYLEENPHKFFLTDVWWNEPDISGPIPHNCIVTPHIGGMGKEFLKTAVERACINLKEYMDGRPRNVIRSGKPL